MTVTETEKAKSPLGEICVRLGKITDAQLVEVIAQQRQTGQRIGDILRDRGLVNAHDIAEAMAVQLGVPFHDLEAVPADSSVARLLPSQAALTFVMLPVSRSGSTMRLAMLNPADSEALLVAARLTGLTPEPVLGEGALLRRALNTLYGGAGGQDGTALLLSALFPGAFGESDDYAAASAMAATGSSVTPVQSAIDTLGAASDPEAVEQAAKAMLSVLLEEAVQIGATALSVEPQGGHARIAYRLPRRQQRRALLRSAHTLPHAANVALLSEIKRQAYLDIGERRRAQRGWLSPITEQGLPSIDTRVAVLPEMHGERVTLQLLRRDPVGPELLDRFNPSPAQRERLASLLSRRGGLILVTGQNWQETLYSLVTVLSQDEGANARTVLTCELAVRYEIPNTSQCVVEPMEMSPEAIAIAVSNAVDAIQGQDPDVVMVNASAAHPRVAAAVCRVSAVSPASSPLVLVGMSAAGDSLDAAGAAAALKQAIGAEAAASALLGVYSERRLRRLCLSCRTPEETTESVATRLGLTAGEMVYRAVGCPRCENTGYVGEFDVQEVLTCDGGFARMLRENVDAWTLRHYAVQQGMASLKEIAIARIRVGLTSPAEVIAQG
ncbi:MAG: Flp pilus assembly complex ATPase component TadA, partial [Fibrella sp.]|nr:Flp pilus assembly complex ATPase component TadA [Armatimonadota bacterium]